MKGCEKSRRVRGEEGDRLVKAAAISDNFTMRCFASLREKKAQKQIHFFISYLVAFNL